MGILRGAIHSALAARSERISGQPDPRERPGRGRPASYCPHSWDTDNSTIKGRNHTHHQCVMPPAHKNTNHLCRYPGCGATVAS
jgi:hypothetical protein